MKVLHSSVVKDMTVEGFYLEDPVDRRAGLSRNEYMPDFPGCCIRNITSGQEKI
jgi:hypothetical protein